MGETFYSVLGVERDADTQTIKQAYREKVKTHHPDVSDADDAEETFRRLTDARDVLVDANSRKQYDRVGHREYVHRYLDSNAWTVGSASSSDGSNSRATGSSTSSGSSARRSTSSSNRNRRSRSRRRSSGSRTSNQQSGTAKDYQRYKSGYSPEDEEWDEGFDETTGTERETGTASNRAWTEDEFDTSASSANASTTSSSDPREHARNDAWKTAQAAASGYSPTGHEPTATGVEQSGLAKVSDAARQIGPWLAFHFVFLVSAFVTVWLFVTWTPSLPTMLISVLLLGFAIFFSILHMISRIYS